jgi:hypothetical protein
MGRRTRAIGPQFRSIRIRIADIVETFKVTSIGELVNRAESRVKARYLREVFSHFRTQREELANPSPNLSTESIPIIPYPFDEIDDFHSFCNDYPEEF